MSTGQYYTHTSMTPGLTSFDSPLRAQYDPGSYEATGQSVSMANANTAAGAQTQSALYAKQAQIQAAQAAADASKYASNQQLAGIQAQLGYKQGIFNQLFPEYTSALGTVQGQAGGQSGGGSVALPQGSVTDVSQLGGGSGSYGYGANAPDSAGLAKQISDYKPTVLAPPTLPNAPDVTKAPPIPEFQQAKLLNPQDKPVISDDLLNQQINSSYAANQQRAATDIQGTQNQMGGRGLGTSSPLSKSLQAQIQGTALGANSSAYMAAQNNAASQNAAYAQAMNQALIQQASQVYGSQTGLLGSEYGTQTQGQTSLYNAQLQALMQGYGTQQGALTSQGNAYLGALQSMYGSQLGLQGQLGSSQMAANANIYGSNIGFQQGIKQSEIQAQWEKQNAILSSLAAFANG